MAKDKLTFMNSLRSYIVSNGICELTLQDIYNMVCKNIYYGVFSKIMNELRMMVDIKHFYIDTNIHKNVNYFDDGTGTTVLSALDSQDCVKDFFERNDITYHFKDNTHYIEVKKFPCNVICKGTQVGYNKKWIELTTMIIDCSFSFNSIYYPLSLSYKVDHLESQERYNNTKNFKNLDMVLFQPDFQEDVSMLVTKNQKISKIVSKKDIFTSLKFVQRISEEILSGTCNYIVAPVKTAQERIDNTMSEEEVFNKVVNALSNDYIAMNQISRSSGISGNIILETLRQMQQKMNKNKLDFEPPKISDILPDTEPPKKSDIATDKKIKNLFDIGEKPILLITGEKLF